MIFVILCRGLRIIVLQDIFAIASAAIVESNLNIARVLVRDIVR